MTDASDGRPRAGYLLLAGISGYTAFLTGTELEHAHAIIRELTKLIRQRLAPPIAVREDRCKFGDQRHHGTRASERGAVARLESA